MINYTVYVDNDLIYNRKIIDEHGRLPYLILNPVLDEKADGFCSLTYRCKVGSPAYDLSVEMIPRVKVYENGNLYWTGRILKSTPNINAEKEIYTEDFLGVLCDGIYRPFEFYGTVADFLQSIVNANNSQVAEGQKIQEVVCDVDVGNIVRSSEGYETCWQVIKSKLLDMIGGYIWIEYDGNENAVLHYSMNARNTSTQKIVFGDNLVNYKVTFDFDGFYTAIVPLGAKNNETKEYLTIASVNDGLDYLIDTTNAALYGVIYAPPSETTWEDVHEPAILKTKALQWLQNKAARLIKEIELSAHDLSGLNTDLRAFHWLDAVPVEAKEIDDTFIIKNLRRPLDKPLQIQINMGDSRTSLTGSTVANQNAAINRIEAIESDYTTTEDVQGIVDVSADAINGELEAIRQETLTQITSIRQEANQIIASALEEYVKTEDLDTLMESISSELAILANRIEFNFESTSESITEVDGTYSAAINNILSFIRLLPTTQTQEGGVVIGESTSNIKLKLENDVLYFFTGDETTVNTTNALAYFSAGQLYVNRSQIQVLSIGTSGAYMHFSVIGSGSTMCLFLSPREV